GFCGMETPLFTLLAVTAALLRLGEPRPARAAALVAVLVLATLTRPEGALVACVLLAVPRERGEVGRRRRDAVLAAAYVALLVPYLGWKASYYGSLVPNTAYAKVTPGLHTLREGLDYVHGSLAAHGLWGLLVPF